VSSRICEIACGGHAGFAALAERDQLLDDRTQFLRLGQVVTICSCLISEAAMLANMALRWLRCG
jgi:hypothetical protein